ncbi:hypothetical protein EV193_11828 [Herbihabitans rhizosphaerae]|uniref:Uncharacterized protein n=1 Tax=Herbihabitans rhizosphaerae TaxID=1872711 RepID=A0A4Q7KC54_9PSEU|nr:hypothetical protein [Herbihabitans rhizosphaerae]RZS29774.1 hypothetical protein EV193_11828 [Herbihabitans rhizosphaerae]
MHDDWPSGAPSVFDVDHAETARFFWAHGQPSRCFLADLPSTASRDLTAAISTGYTMLQALEKLAVVDNGTLVREWPPSEEKGHPGNHQPYQIVLPPGERGYPKLGSGHWPYQSAYHEAADLSARIRGRVTLCRMLWLIGWH